MLINKWLITDTINHQDALVDQHGICFYVPAEPADAGSLYNDVQSLPVQTDFVILLSGNDFDQDSKNDSYIKKLVGFFFMPQYYQVYYQPLVFLRSSNAAATNFLEKLNEKCKSQGIRNLLVLEIDESSDPTTETFACLISDEALDLHTKIKKWITGNINGNITPEINLLIPGAKKEMVRYIDGLENDIKKTEAYKIAATLYHKQQLIEESKHQLYLKSASEENTRSYLDIQKADWAKESRWYYNEYEVLPTWYKRFGHVIKVIMGKRSFKSLFNDKIKKHTD